ncbi:amino acid adenylation domain-containing protein [Streptomyces sp. NPDC005438]|uniref:amino acid adenylation domain-containing protein n=1 Tax=Streptomyces sp. NPDC005438 TaxID=3156880 RepID=UPI0033BC3BD8
MGGPPERTGPASPLVAAVLAQASRTPGAPAVVDGQGTGTPLRYADLDRLSRVVARGLDAHGVRPGQAVAVCLPRSWELVVVMLGIRRAGATVVPLDGASPAERRRQMLEDSGARLLVRPEPPPPGATGEPATVLVRHLLDTPDGPHPPVPEDRDAPVSFLYYTSGTTGRPKGVEVLDAGVLRLALPGGVGAGPGARYACLSNPAFDALSFEVWVPLLTGGSCVVIDDEQARQPRELARVLREARVDALFVTTALFNAVVDAVPDCFATVGRVLVGGEQLDAERVSRWYRDNPDSGTELANVYGPTECTTFALWHPVPRAFHGEVVPVGRPLPATHAVLVAEGRRPAEDGELGEIHLAGEGLAAGYHHLPEETAHRFARLPWYDGGRQRWYRTGDLARRDGTGLIRYVGRADRQVKVRGFRVEPAEVERGLTAHPAIRQARVCALRDPDGAHRLLAYLVLDSELALDAYHRHLTATLPPAMRPHRTHRVPELPLTAQGKVDERALLDADTPPWRHPPKTDGPLTDLQREVLELAGQLLGDPDLSLDDRWAASGGDSLTALRLRHEARRRWGTDLPQSVVFDTDLAGLARALAHGPDPTRTPPPPVPSGRNEGPATSEQHRLWLLHQRDPDSRAYDVPLAFLLDGPPDTEALRAALRRLVARHPALRTSFHATPQGLRQRIDAPYDPWQPTRSHRHQSWREALAPFPGPPFDLSRPRMLRAGLLHTADGPVLALHLHHIAVDGWSLNLLFRELSADLAGSPAPETPAPTPVDAALWQDEHRHTPDYRAHLQALGEHYADHPPTPSRRTPAGAGDGRARLLPTHLDRRRTARLDRLAAERGLTRFPLLLAAYAWALYGVTGDSRPTVATPVAGRPAGEFAPTVGMFANTLLLPLRLAPDEELRHQLPRHARETARVLAHQDVALADLLDAGHLDLGSGAPFDYLFVLENTDFEALTLPGRTARPLWPEPAEAKCALTLSVLEQGDGLHCLWEYREGGFDAERVTAVAELFRRAVDLLTDETPDTPATLTELVAPYRRALPDHGRGPTGNPSFTTLSEGFARQVRRTPGAPAVTGGGRAVSYAQLDARVRGLAARLAALPLPPDPEAPARVALYLPPSVEQVVALLAAARQNLTVVPLDPGHPAALTRRILDRADPLCVLVPPGPDPELPGWPELPLIPVESDTPTAHHTPPGEPLTRTRPLYTLFTSGSTGEPKGVDVPESTLVNLLHWQHEHGGLQGARVTQQYSALSFDVSFQEILTTLCAGGALHLLDPGWRHDLPALLEHLEDAGVERIFLPYVALSLLAEHGVRLQRFPSRLREVVTAGEQLVCTDALRRWFAGLPDARLFNHYGPTETHVVSGLCLSGDPGRWPDRPAVGRPVSGAVLRVVDDEDRPLPPGAVGHLLIGGPMAAPCYLHAPDLNRARFTELPGEGVFHRSGDLAHLDDHGLFHHDGRRDDQVKLSGHRLELGQVEAALLQHPDVHGAAVDLRDGALTAVLRCRTQDDPHPEELNSHLSRLLPAHVRVAHYRRVDALPHTPSGKLDRRAALTLPGRALAAPAPAPPGDAPPVERRLCALFTEATGRPLSPEQRFFDAGATSWDLMRFHLRCQTEPDLTFTVADLFEHVTVRGLSRFLERPQPRTATPADRHPGGTTEPVAVVGMAVRLPGAEDLAAFWHLVTTAGSGIEHFPAADGLVGARSQLDRPLAFDPQRFGISPHTARLMDPQQRHLLMCCVQALAHAGIGDPTTQRVGLVAGCGENTHFQALLREADPTQLPDRFQLAPHHDKDFLATKVAYHLGLTGPALTAQTACSSSLVGTHLAAGLLRQGDAEVMLAGGVLIDPDLTDGYHYRPQHILSPDGHCRPFSDDAAGTVGASGVGVVVLKPLSRARQDGDTVYAVLTGSAVNNDGAQKLGYSAPSLAGQREVVREALRRSGHRAEDIGYVEAHGTGTRLGDPVEVGALRQAYQLTEPGGCALSSVKSQLGHLGAAAGVVGLVRATLAVHHELIPPTPDFHRPNPECADDLTPFRVPTRPEPWPTDQPRVAAVSSFGIGGTNAHLLLTRDTEPDPPPTPPDPPCLVLSAHSLSTLRADARRIADYLDTHPGSYPRVLRHLRSGRTPSTHRAAAVHHHASTAVDWLRALAADPSGATHLTDADPSPPRVDATRATPHAVVEAWLAGAPVDWPDGSAQAPWDFPPPSFDLTDHDPPRARTTPPPHSAPARQPRERWLHQTRWTRLRRATAGAAPEGRVLVVLTDDPSAPTRWKALEQHPHTRVVHLTAATEYARLGPDHHRLDPTDPRALSRFLAELGPAPAGVDWLHALPLGVTGPVDEQRMDQARWACLDTPAALCRALAEHPGPRPRLWWLSHRAQPVDSGVDRPELGLLAGAAHTPRQELDLETRWVDLPGDEPADWADLLPALLARDPGEPRLALRQGHWWRPTPTTVPAPEEDPDPLPETDGGTHLVLGGTGGVGSAVAGWLLDHTSGRAVLVARHPQLPQDLRRFADRITLVAADLADEPLDQLTARLAPHLERLRTVTHAVGTAAGGLLVRRDPLTSDTVTRAKLRAALLVERLVAAHRPDRAVYCSSLSAQFGGVGQFDYAAGNGALDGFAQYEPATGTPPGGTVRTGIGWDVWREAGMARDALAGDPRHQAHLEVGLTTAEARGVLNAALTLGLPHLCVSTTAPEEAPYFYEPPAPSPTPTPDLPPPPGRPAEELSAATRRLLGVERLDPDSSLYDLGADSLTLLDVLTEVRRLYGTDLELSQLGHRVSLNEILGHLERPTPGSHHDPVTVEVWQQGEGRRVLCLIHPVGGDIQAYRPLVSALDPRLTVCLIPDPALRHDGVPDWSLTERAAAYHSALRGRFSDLPLRLLGWSFGAWVAVSMAAEAEATGHPVNHLYLLDPPPPGAGPTLGGYDEDTIDTVFRHELREHSTRTRQLGPSGQSYADRLAARCRANLAAMAGHHPPRLTATPGTVWLAAHPVTDLPAYGDPERTARQWADLLAPPPAVHQVPAHHFGLLTPPHVRHLARAVNDD